jgi:hypothetical protein
MSLLCIVLIGCEETAERTPDQSLINTKLVDSLNNLAIENAIVAQHTLFPYHFVRNGPELNELGQRDLAVLANHFLENAGPLNVRKGDTVAELYEARVSHVLDGLKEAGIELERIAVADGMPGGPGMPSEKVVTILESAEKAAEKGTARTTGFTSGTSGTIR